MKERGSNSKRKKLENKFIFTYIYIYNNKLKTKFNFI